MVSLKLECFKKEKLLNFLSHVLNYLKKVNITVYSGKSILIMGHLIFLSPVQCFVTQSWPTLFHPTDCGPPGSSVHGDSPGKNTGVGCHALLQVIFPTQGSNPGLPHCGQILYSLSHQGSPRILEWAAYPFSQGSSPPRNQSEVSCIAGTFFTS